MLKIDKYKQIYLACGQTDMRQSINGLMMIVQNSFKLDPFNGALFVFCNKNRNILKILEWDQDGFWLHQKRLEVGHFKWPNAKAGAKTMSLNSEEILQLLKGPGLEQKLKRKEISGRAII